MRHAGASHGSTAASRPPGWLSGRVTAWLYCLLEDLGVAGLVAFAVSNPVAAGIVAAVVLAGGIALIALLA